MGDADPGARWSTAAIGCGSTRPYGAMLPGMAYLVRRLLENTSNESFLKASFAAHARIDDLLRNPEEIGAMLTRTRRPKADRRRRRSGELPPFRNEPPTDFARAENREAMRRALDEVRGQLGRHYPLIDRRRGGRHRARAARLARPEPQLARRGRDVAWPVPSTPSGRSPRPGRRIPGLGGDAGPRPRRGPGPRGRDHAAATVRAGRVGGLRVRQALGRGRRRRRRGDRLLRVLRPRDDPPGRAPAPRRPRRDQFHRAPAARRGRGHPPLELPAGDPDAA